MKVINKLIMKKIFSLSLLLFSIQFCALCQTNVIEFDRTGTDVNSQNPVFISIKPYTIHLQDEEIKQIKSLQAKSINMTTDDFIKLHYVLIITDSVTFSRLVNYINTHYSSYTNNLQTNPEYSPQKIIRVNDRNYVVYNPLVYDYFMELRSYLKQEKCDLRVLGALEYF
jgi:hypothetical protein